MKARMSDLVEQLLHETDILGYVEHRQLYIPVSKINFTYSGLSHEIILSFQLYYIGIELSTRQCYIAAWLFSNDNYVVLIHYWDSKRTTIRDEVRVVRNVNFQQRDDALTRNLINVGAVDWKEGSEILLPLSMERHDYGYGMRFEQCTMTILEDLGDYLNLGFEQRAQYQEKSLKMAQP